ncbi:MAG: hypothetical protein K6F59_01350 [Gammaproteobacteria bacterium]|nr:hypothetical protein [Gammaproteobacteria bacterium]
MRRFAFRHKVLNFITAGVFIAALILGIVGQVIEEVDYVGKGLYYIIGAICISFASINMFASFKKGNKVGGNIAVAVVNLLIIALGFILIIHRLKVSNGTNTYTDEEFFFNPSHTLGISLYIEGIMLVIANKFNESEKVTRTIVGILILTFGVVSFIWLKDKHLAITFLVFIGLLGMYYLYVGFRPVPPKPIEPPKEKPQEIKENKKKSIFSIFQKEKVEAEEKKELPNEEVKQIELQEKKEEDEE